MGALARTWDRTAQIRWAAVTPLALINFGIRKVMDGILAATFVSRMWCLTLSK